MCIFRYLACALLLRGKVNISDIRKNIERLRPSLKFVYWNQEGWKTGLCSVPPLNQPYSLLALANNTCFANTLENIGQRYEKLFKRKAHIHHYTKIDGMDLSVFHSAFESLTTIIQEYRTIDKTSNNVGLNIPNVARLKIC
jgi:tubulin epsilon